MPYFSSQWIPICLALLHPRSRSLPGHLIWEVAVTIFWRYGLENPELMSVVKSRRGWLMHVWRKDHLIASHCLKDILIPGVDFRTCEIEMPFFSAMRTLSLRAMHPWMNDGGTVNLLLSACVTIPICTLALSSKVLARTSAANGSAWVISRFKEKIPVVFS